MWSGVAKFLWLYPQKLDKTFPTVSLDGKINFVFPFINTSFILPFSLRVQNFDHILLVFLSFPLLNFVTVFYSMTLCRLIGKLQRVKEQSCFSLQRKKNCTNLSRLTGLLEWGCQWSKARQWIRSANNYAIRQLLPFVHCVKNFT